MENEEKKRIFICGDFKFPHGDAVANRMHYIARMAKDIGIEPYIISAGENSREEWDIDEKVYVHDGIKYKNVKRRAGNPRDFMQRGIHAAQFLKDENVSSKDIILISSIWPHYTYFLRKKVGEQLNIFFDVMEWFQPFQFKGGRFNFWYESYNYYFEHTVMSGNGVLVISHELENYYKKRGKKVFCLPLVLDPYNYPCKERKASDKLKFIYPGNPGRKDAMNVMLKGLNLLKGEERNKIEFHITGVKRETLEQILDKEKNLLDKTKDIVSFHGWLSYSDLYDLYNQMDFFLLAKEDNLVSRSNFPSKVPELMSCGVIPVMNEVGDIGAYLKDRTDCILYSKCRPEDCAIGIKQALSIREKDLKKMKSAARKTAEEKFNYRNWSNATMTFLSEGLNDD